MLAIFLVKGVRMRKKGAKNPFVLSFGANAPIVKRKSSLDGMDRGARINGAGVIPDPPCLSTVKRGGGVRNPGCTSSTALISVPGSTTMKAIPDPPRLSTFKRRGGGSGIGLAAFQRIRS
jgi:hypothetical protein